MHDDPTVEGAGMELERYDPFDGALGFSLAVRAGDAIHVAGMIGMDSSNMSIPEDIEGQMRLSYQNLGEVLDHFGCTLADVASQTVFFVGEHDVAMAAAAVVRPEVFGRALPASAMVGVERLVDPRFLVEVQVVAYMPT
jgi:2-iminobutanoate/2-iminopropanoate deaminase